ncbi:MAG: helix-turn-helix domain-containing protein [Planctomycetota bacterium]
MSELEKLEIREALASLAAAHSFLSDHLERAIASLTIALEQEPKAFQKHPGSSKHLVARVFVDDLTMSIHWRGSSCFLGNTLLFHLFARLARTPNCYVNHADLLNDVWHGRRDLSTIRGVVKRLRDRLAAAGMSELAGAIDGSVAGHYCLKLA